MFCNLYVLKGEIGMWITALLGVVGSAIGGLFGMKKDQANVVQGALKSLDGLAGSDGVQAKAAAASIAALYVNGGWLERSWRPTLMWVTMGLIIARWFGYVPPGIDAEEINHIYTFLEIGLVGYIPLRSVDKALRGFQIGSILKKYIEKKVL